MFFASLWCECSAELIRHYEILITKGEPHARSIQFTRRIKGWE